MIRFTPDWPEGMVCDLWVSKTAVPTVRDLNTWASATYTMHVALSVAPHDTSLASVISTDQELYSWFIGHAPKVLYVNSLGKPTHFAPVRLLPKEVALKRVYHTSGTGSKQFFEEIYDEFAKHRKSNGSAVMTVGRSSGPLSGPLSVPLSDWSSQRGISPDLDPDPDPDPL